MAFTGGWNFRKNNAILNGLRRACNEIVISLLFKSTFKYSGTTNTQNIRIRQGGLKMEKNM